MMTRLPLRLTRRCAAPRLLRRAALTLAMTVWPTTRAAAQTLAQQTTGEAVRTGPSHVLSVNPFLPLLGFFSGEFEQRLTPALAAAVSGSRTKPGDTRYTNLDVKARLYPSEHGLRGVHVAAALGVAFLNNEGSMVLCVPPPVPVGGGGTIDFRCGAPTSFTTGTFAIEAGYQTFVGRRHVTADAVGIGAKRYLGSDSKYSDIARVLPTLRLSVGYAF